MKKIILYSLTTVLIIFALFIVYGFASPVPVALLIRRSFQTGTEVTRESYDEALAQVIQINDLDYHSAYRKGTLDIITPRQATQKLPVIIWVHGGGFVGGDKRDITGYAVELAAQGYAVVNMNYQLAPEAKYPTPLLQLEEAYNYIKQNADQLQFDMNNVFFAGDSAGAQIVSQFLLIQTDSSYSAFINIRPSVDPTTIRGALLYCGPYNIRAFVNIKGTFGFLLGRMAWSYTGLTDWATHESIRPLSIIDYVSRSFPATFITDGNQTTFTQQGMDLADKLRSLQVPTTAVFYDSTKVTLNHEYQFNMTLAESVTTFNLTVNFLNQNRLQRD